MLMERRYSVGRRRIEDLSKKDVGINFAGREKSETRGNGDVCYGTCHHALHNVGSFNSQEDSLLIPVMYFSPLFDASACQIHGDLDLYLQFLDMSSLQSALPNHNMLTASFPESVAPSMEIPNI
ncbi:hypothetical protein L2E82_05934 [Cichorium intybus]|uniref:Uncharacterized protein n=1 Tax=Cichorium intybus TaxID=13427 RepID=A0ACB9HA60_CICIN|nr:hypothetical protein L2E82_05934 [Cichorium intybus]